jgi:hypothetical protein
MLIIITTINIPTQTPALKIPPITAQLLRKKVKKTISAGDNFFIFLLKSLNNRASRKKSNNQRLASGCQY